MHKSRSLLRSESGLNIVMLTGVLTLMLLFAAFAVNVARYYTLQSQLHALANQVAGYAGTYLPNPSRTSRAAWQAFEMLKMDLRKSGSVSRFPQNLYMQVYFDHVSSANSTYLRRRTDTNSIPYTFSSSGLRLPIKSLVVKIGAPFDLSFLNFTAESGISLVDVTTTATTQLSATDVVLIIENSNSVISPIESESAGVLSTVGSVFTSWTDTKIGRNGDYDSRFTNPSKALTRARQCFGQVTKDIKRGAVLAYDMLSSSATYRVGVIHTLNLSGEFPTPTIKITADSYAKSYNSNDSNNLNSSIFDFPTPNSRYGSFDYKETACGALTQNADFKVPRHPYGGSAANATNTAYSLASMMNCGGTFDSDCSGNSHLNFISAPDPDGPPAPAISIYAMLRPRDLLWITNAGVTSEIGYPFPKFDYVPMQLAVQRAFDMLRDAPQRTDKIPVKRKMVLVFTDGFEKPFSDKTGHNNALDDTDFTRVPEVIKTGSSFSKDQHTFSYGLGGVPTLNGLHENYCELDAANNPIIPELSDPATEAGIKLGVLYYSRRGPLAGVTSEPLDPLVMMRDLVGHTSDDAEDFRTECNTVWTSNGGRFFVEIPTGNSITASTYYSQVVPRVLRSVLVSEISE